MFAVYFFKFHRFFFRLRLLYVFVFVFAFGPNATCLSEYITFDNLRSSIYFQFYYVILLFYILLMPS